MLKEFEELPVFEKAYNVSLEVHKISLQLPKIEQYAIADQIRRASKSILQIWQKDLQNKLDLKRIFVILSL